jgi:CheY-like chemotaxis protein
MKHELLRVFLADDDEDDCMLFEDALQDIDQKIELIISRDGVELMNTLQEKVPPPPHVLFLDLNMPRKNGFECLKEIKLHGEYKNIPIVVLSTSNENEHIQRTFEDGANLYARKPGNFLLLKKLIEHVLTIDWKEHSPKHLNQFLLTQSE